MAQSDAPLITDSSRLQAVVAAARNAGTIGLDTEFLREKTYRARLCLAQIATDDAIWLIDPVDGADLGAIAELLSDPHVEVIVHAGKQDFEIFYERYGAVPRNIYDVQLAAAFAGYGASLPYGRLVAGTTDVKLTKGESYTDWCRRPLTSAQLRYAADDVRYLIPVAERLRKDLENLDRTSWVQEEMSLLEEEDAYRVDLQNAWRRIGGRGTLSGRQTAVLQEVAAWREETAAERDLPRGWVVKDATLVEIARRGPKNIGDLKSVRGLNAREADRSGQLLLAAVDRGRRADPMEKPIAPTRSIQARARMVSNIADAVVRARAEGASLATELVATRGELDALLVDVFSGTVDESRHRLLQGWRRRIAGDAVLALATGKLAVRVVDRPPYVEEVEEGAWGNQ